MVEEVLHPTLMREVNLLYPHRHDCICPECEKRRQREAEEVYARMMKLMASQKVKG